MQNRFYSDELKSKLSAQIDKVCGLVTSENKQHRTNSNDTLEAIFRRVINTAKGLKLEDLNKGSKQAAGIDLADDTARISYQITAESRSSKIHDCLDKFESERHYEKYDNLIILFSNDYMTKLADLSLKTYSFDPLKITTLMNKDTLKSDIESNCEIEQLQEVVDYLDMELSPLVDDPTTSLPAINNILGKCVELMQNQVIAVKTRQDLPLYVKDKIILNFEDTNEADQVSRYLMNAMPYSDTISDAINSFVDLDSSDLEEYMMDVYNRYSSIQNKNSMETLLQMFDDFIPAGYKDDLVYITWSRRFVLKYFENCTIFKRSKSELTQGVAS